MRGGGRERAPLGEMKIMLNILLPSLCGVCCSNAGCEVVCEPSQEREGSHLHHGREDCR